MVNFMDVIRKYIRNKRYKKYLKLKQEFSDLEPPKILREERNIVPFVVTRHIDVPHLSEEQWPIMFKHCKSDMAHELAVEIMRNTTFEVFDSKSIPYIKIIRGTVYIAKKEGM